MRAAEPHRKGREEMEGLDGVLGEDGVAGERYLASGLAMVDR